MFSVEVKSLTQVLWCDHIRWIAVRRSTTVRVLNLIHNTSVIERYSQSIAAVACHTSNREVELLFRLVVSELTHRTLTSESVTRSTRRTRVNAYSCNQARVIRVSQRDRRSIVSVAEVTVSTICRH